MEEKVNQNISASVKRIKTISEMRLGSLGTRTMTPLDFTNELAISETMIHEHRCMSN
jgi:hypothetical protein